MSSRPPTDWEAIEREYRAGQLSIREIARQHGISDTAIRKQAKELAWERDLTEQVAAKVRSDLVRSEVRSAPCAEREIVAMAAARGVEVIRRHRHDCAQLSATRDRYLQRLISFRTDTADPRTLAQYADVLESLTRITERLLNVEQRVFNLTQVVAPNTSQESLTKFDRRAVELLARLRSGGVSAADCAPSVDTSQLGADRSIAE